MPSAAAADQNPNRPPDWEKETEALDEDGERGVVPARVEDGDAGRRRMMWAEREAPPPASRDSRLPRGHKRRGRNRAWLLALFPEAGA